MVRYKPVPEPRDREGLFAVRDSLPLAPAAERFCRNRLRDAGVAPEEAREWLTFLVALELAEHTGRGYRRTRGRPARAVLGDRFLANVFGAREAVGATDGDGADTEAPFRAVRAVVPAWERGRYPDFEREYRERTRRLLGWARTFGLDGRTEGPAGTPRRRPESRG